MQTVTYERKSSVWNGEDEAALQLAAQDFFFAGDLRLRKSPSGGCVKIETAPVLPISIVSYVSNPGQAYRRTLDHIRANPIDVYLLWLIEHGCLKTTQSETTHITPSDALTVTRSDHPFLQELAASNTGPFTAKVALLPGHLFRPAVAARHGFLGRPLSMRSGIGRALRGLVDLLYEDAGDLSYATQNGLVTQVLQLLSEAAARPEMEIAPRLTAGQRRKHLVMGYIDANLLRKELNPSLAAENCGISRGHLHRLFSEDGTTFSRYVQKRRLEISKTWLRSAEMQAHSISEIADMVGFSSVAHYSRAFHAEFGCSPRHARQRVTPDAEEFR